MSPGRIELCVGPLLFNWPAAEGEAFYARIAAHEAVDRVYLGEVVCGKRAPRLAEALDRAAERLGASGKTVVWSSLALPATARERRAGLALATRPEPVEVNDISILAHRPPGAPFVAGPLLNAYNEAAARELIRRGCQRLCANVELPLASVAAVARACPELELEIFAYGRLPLALSARTYVQTTRILREAVSNIIKHSGSSHCDIAAIINRTDFQIIIHDNGRGIPMQLDGKLDRGHGMSSMKSRAKQLQGQCLVESGPNLGTIIRLTLPLEIPPTNEPIAATMSRLTSKAGPHEANPPA